jgi:DNA-binding transcriptional ArsR family regulator
MHALEVLGDPVRRRLVELLGEGERTAGELTARIREEFAVGQPAVSNQLRVLRETGFARSTPRGSRRLYALERARLDEVDAWVQQRRSFWTGQLGALGDAMDHGNGKDER